MPYEVTIDRQEALASPGASASEAAIYEVRLWPHQSLTSLGFVWIIGGAYVMTSLPLIALLGTSALWGILPFALFPVTALWWSVHRNWRDRDIEETLTVTPETARLIRRDPNGRLRDWEANPYWVRIKRHDKVDRIEDYLTLEGGPRRVELGSFLTPGERRYLLSRVETALRRVR